MGRDTETVELEVELSSSAEVLAGSRWEGADRFDGIKIQFQSGEVGHGFGMGEVVSVLITIPVGVASTLIAEALREAAKVVIRRAQSRRHRNDGSVAGLAEVIDAERAFTHQSAVRSPEATSAINSMVEKTGDEQVDGS